MNTTTFLAQWTADYPGVAPIREQLNAANFASRWMRVHSLPLSKRYPDTQSEWSILLHRQNTLIDHCIPQGTAILIVVNLIEPDSALFGAYDLQPLGIVQVAQGEPAYDSFVFETIWESSRYNTFLRMIANEELRAFIVAPDCLIGPYDGGVDVIAKDDQACQALKGQFKDWLSARDDGL